MCLSRSAVAQHQRLQPRVEHERRHGVDELRLEQLDGRDLGEQEPPRVPVAEVDLLQVLVEVALGEQVPLVGRPPPGGGAPARARPSSPGRRRAPRAPPPRARAPRSGACRSGARPSSAPSSRCTSGARESSAARSSVEHVAVELGRPADRLAGVVDDVVEPVVGREQVVAELLDARRVAQVEAVDLEPVAPSRRNRPPARSGRRSRGGSASSRSGGRRRGAA